MGEDFVLGHPQACLSTLGSQAHTVLFSSNMGRLWVQSHIGKRSAPLMLYKCLAQAWVYHYYTCVVVVEACPSWVTKPCEYHTVSNMAKPIPPFSQSGQYSWWALSLKSAFLWGRILYLATRKLVCPLWGAKLARFCSQAAWVSFSGSTHFWKPLDSVPHRQEKHPTHAL